MKTVIEILNDIENEWNKRETWTDFLEWCRNWWIYALREAKERIQKETWWISVKDRFPPRDMPVYCYLRWHGKFQWLWTGNENIFQVQYLWTELQADFWMPLPLHPNE